MLACSTQKFSGILVDLYFQFSNFGFKQASKQNKQCWYLYPDKFEKILSRYAPLSYTCLLHREKDLPVWSVSSPANFWRSPDDTPRSSAIANQTSSTQQSHHARGPVFPHVLGRTSRMGVPRLGADPWALGAISLDARCVATAVAMQSHHHSNNFTSLQKRKSLNTTHTFTGKAKLLG